MVDGVPWGGAFNPMITTLDMNDVQRIEVLKGAAPVMCGATSFVGVVQTIRSGEPTNATGDGPAMLPWRSSPVYLLYTK